ncbi:hypothetical protein B566_EDAN008334 [Ephemera danica]|nr:hypothetical protein B566_EDAN008334 [Ephemera danica]
MNDILLAGQVGNVITNRNANRLEFERLLDGAKTYMRHHKVPGDMKRRVLRWYDYSWSRGRIQGGGDINTALGLLPDKLKTELALHVNLSVLKKVTIFQECQPEFLHDLVLKMKAYIFTPGDLICRKGEVAREMFIIADGILEVISETGRVLTTMKAGDFFGEIGILNLDGLNKRTADVRSVGYSELFSLSREDEILQSLGRKRLMEARNVSRAARGGSKRRGSGEIAPPAAGDSSDSTGKRIVDKLRSDVKGLKNVLRKSRRSTSSKEDSMELQPLTRSDAGPRGSTDISANTSKPPRIKKLLLRSINVESSTSHDSTSGSGSGGKAKMLRRMGHVRSDEATEPPAQPPAQPEVIGAGLPLLQRLLLLKAKEDREEREQVKLNKDLNSVRVTRIVFQQAAIQQSKAPVVPTSSSPVVSEVVGAGLPLMARLRLLKQREEAATLKPAPLKSPSPQPSTDCSLSPPSSAEVPSSRPWPLLVTRSDESVKSPTPVAQTVQAQIEEPPPYESPPTVLSPALKSPIIVTTPPIPSPPSVSSPLSVVSPVMSPPAVFSPSPSISSPPVTSPQPISPTSPPCVTSPPSVTSPLSVTSPVSSSGSDRSPKPSLLSIRQDTKFYQSIDDLSPEYSGLPFVKKLKILNERQKLAALVECTATVRSSSLDSGNTPHTDMFSAITRSRSEACDIDYVQRTRGLLTGNLQLSEPQCDTPPSPGTPPSPECNETLERRNLKSILKKLSSSSEENKDKKPASKLEFRRLLRAQTVEGYAARHSKFAKSVTFNRDSVSPPPAPTTQEAPQTKSKMNFLLPSLLMPPLEARREEEFFGDVITGMKTVLQNHMEEIQSKFQLRFQSLELESTTRDDTVDETLHNEVETAMRNGGGSEDGDVSDQEETTYSDQPFMRGDSVDTVVTPSNSPIPPDTSSSSSSSSGDTDSELETHDSAARGASWEDRSEEESLELLELPRSLSPQALWQHVALDVASSGSSSSSSSPPPGHNRDWEVQMLAEELDRRDQRSRLEGELAELAGKSRLSRSELDILDRVLQESARSEVKNRSFDEDHASPRHRRRNTSESSCSVEHLNVMRTDTMRSSLLRNRLPHHKKHEESGLVSWLHRRTSHQSQQQQPIGKQYLNARSLEEPAGSVERPPPQTQGRSSSIGHLPVPSSSSSSSTRHSLFGFSRLRLSTLSHSLRGFTRPASASQASSSETVATISLQPPEPPS